MSHRQVARQTGVSKRTVTRIAQETAVEAVDDRAEVQRRSIGRPAQAGAFQDHVRQIRRGDVVDLTAEAIERLGNGRG